MFFYRVVKSSVLLFSVAMISAHAQKISPIHSSLQQLNQFFQCQGCELAKANLENYDLTQQASPKIKIDCSLTFNLSYANLQQAQIRHSSFTACQGGNITPFASIDFSHANMSQSDVSFSRFNNVNFSYADLTKGQWSHVEASLCDFSYADFSGAGLQYLVSPREAMHGFGSNFYRANFSNADLSHARLYGFFQSANFSHAVLRGAELSTAVDTVDVRLPNWQRMDAGALWTDVNFTDADLTGAVLLNTDQPTSTAWQHAIFCHTKMPDGSINNRDCHQSP